jgi:hypothetical protein
VTSFEPLQETSNAGALIALGGIAALAATWAYGQRRDPEARGWAGKPKTAEEVKGQLTRIRRKREQEGRPDFEVAILGAGASAAYYLQSRGQRLDPKQTVIIGNEQPWAGERGAQGNINHPLNQIDVRHPAMPLSDRTAGLEPREEFSRRIAEVFETWPFHLQEEIKAVRLATAGDRYEITLGGGRMISAKQVIAALGVGPQKGPGNVKWIGDEAQAEAGAIATQWGEPLPRVVGMDEFQRAVSDNRIVPGTIRNVVVVGPNAAIDVVTTLLRSHSALGVRVVQWISGSGKPPFLPGTDNAYTEKAYDEVVAMPDVGGVHSKSLGSVQLSIIKWGYLKTTHHERGVQVNYGERGGKGKPEVPKGTAYGDLMVYGLGPDVAALAGLLGIPEKDRAGALEPIYDVDRRFSVDRFSDQELRTLLGEYPDSVLGKMAVVLGDGDSATADTLLRALKRPPGKELPRLLPTVVGLRAKNTGSARLELVGATAYRLGAKSQDPTETPVGYAFLSGSLQGLQNREVHELQSLVAKGGVAGTAGQSFVAVLGSYVADALAFAQDLEHVRDAAPSDQAKQTLVQLNNSFSALTEAVEAVRNEPDGDQEQVRTLGGVYGMTRTYHAQITEFFELLQANPQTGALAAGHHEVAPYTLPQNVLLGDQLASVRSTIEALQTFLPESLEAGVNFVGADRTAIAAHIAVRYPDIPPLIGEYLAARIIVERRHPQPGTEGPLPRAENPNDPHSRFLLDRQRQFQEGWIAKLAALDDIFFEGMFARVRPRVVRR